MGSKRDIEKFTGNYDFGLWKVKMQTVLTQQKCVEVSKVKLQSQYKVLRYVVREATAAPMWTKLESLYYWNKICLVLEEQIKSKYINKKGSLKLMKKTAPEVMTSLEASSSEAGNH
ncbi:hypothetical protein MTR_2g012760 [Medicago truncatula]|uniref:Uncharacterized protein n=1 Tax=Medicago truncatula TaxID=3880 RepID=G7INY0_MEDTR|nr:hypothetical protein MTR_2g012760 [Medicago truncatula]